MEAFLGLLFGLFVTMVLIPPLVRVSGGLRLLDQPGHRKVHSIPTPRVGGIAVFLGAVLPLLIWAPLDWTVVSYLVAGSLIVIFGAVDDRVELDYKWKILGQTVAALALLAGGVHFERLPFCGLEPVTPWLTYPISFLFILGVTNALNLSDGLDGLAAGNSFLSLAAVAVFAYLAAGPELALAAAALIGAVVGFLRFNTHPAVVFLGDAGSQFLGFSLATLVILLTKDVNPALSSALPLFLVGLPLLDTVSVVVIRLRNGLSPFTPDRRHFHHRLLSVGFEHHEAVSVIYTLQAIWLVLAFVLRYQSDALVVVVFLFLAVAVFGALYLAEARAWRFRREPGIGTVDTGSKERRNLALRRFRWLPTVAAQSVQLGASAFLVLCALFTANVSKDIGLVSFGVAAMMVFAHFFLNPWTPAFTRIGVYMAGLIVVFLLAPMTEANTSLDWLISFYLVVLCCVLALAIRVTRRETFQMTPQDLLMLFFVVAVPSLPLEAYIGYPVGSIVLRAAVVFYSCEYVLNRDRLSYVSLRIAGFAALAILGFRGVVL